ncbi:magnesium/cobalt transporter CorA [Colwellia sp. Arc7-D]|uniref:magnesium/cobalt transporter CorA n=1 Tax=Colwellia sp. Arc7-D TaxID=2161872 RepID=UPI000D3AEB97|nr:magnesium/cobalt transporter CorA [Colwellia sp. Arc7-D]AWB57751.1 magnesium and cobalt transport protein CorA [Colwellia sp. Arc7-D]
MKLFNKQYSQPGTKPGTISQSDVVNYTVSLIDYNKTDIEDHTVLELATCRDFIANTNVTWIHVQGNPSAEAMITLAKGLNIHELHIEDILNNGQRPKVELNEDQIFIILNLPLSDKGVTKIEQVSLFITKNTLISFCSGAFMPFEHVIDRLMANVGKIRKLPADYLMYSLIDTTIDYGFPLLEAYAETIQTIEDELLNTKDRAILTRIHALRKEVLLVRRRIWPHRDLIGDILREEENSVISKNTILHMKDCYDHVESIKDTLESYHEMTQGLMEFYLTSVNLKLNDVIKFLTIFTTVFIPPTFIVGVYGMNFDSSISPFNMPELGWKYGYLGVLGLMAISITGMLMFFKKRRWI